MASGRQRGFTYVAALLLVAALSVGLAATGEVWSQSRQRQKEAELIWVGEQFVNAIGLYYQRSPGTVKRYPEKLEDLLEDKRYVSRQRYLRRIYRDPITGKADWALVRAPEGGIMGVHSSSLRAPIKHTFPDGARARYSDWQFVYSPPSYVGSTQSGSE
jgi:type II secretory pathway pseudopilin PulG